MHFQGLLPGHVRVTGSNRNLSEDGMPFNPKEFSREEQVVLQYWRLTINGQGPLCYCFMNLLFFLAFLQGLNMCNKIWNRVQS